MQARAIFEAAVEAGKRTGKPVVPEIMVPLIATQAPSSISSRRASTRWREAVAEGDRHQGRLPGRHDDRAAARRAAWPARSPRPRSSSPSAPTISRRPRSASAATTRRASSASTRRRASCRSIRSCRSTARASANWCRSRVERGRKARPEAQARHLRRAWRRSGLDRVLPRGRARLRVVLAVPRADRAARRGAGGARQGDRQHGVAVGPAMHDPHARHASVARSGRILTWWFAAMSAAGVLFGAFAEQRPFGDDVLAHPHRPVHRRRDRAPGAALRDAPAGSRDHSRSPAGVRLHRRARRVPDRQLARRASARA